MESLGGIGAGASVDSRAVFRAEPRTFCTILDSGYLVRFVALHQSLMRWCLPFRMIAFCLDRRAARILKGMRLESVEVVPFSELEAADRELAAVKGDRSVAEYCQTAKASALLHAFERYPQVDQATFLDSDLFFFADPTPIFEEMGDSSILITPHHFSPEFHGGRVWGIYNGGVVGFRRDSRGLECLGWWRERCIEWCYLRLEEDRASDQKYLDDWPDRFEGVHPLRHKGGHVAPWNVTQFRLEDGNGEGGLTVDGAPLICFHFQGSILRRRTLRQREVAHEPHSLPYFQPSEQVERLIYKPYFDEIDRSVERVRRKRRFFSAGLARPQ
jgi:hypothetical protein